MKSRLGAMNPAQGSFNSLRDVTIHDQLLKYLGRPVVSFLVADQTHRYRLPGRVESPPPSDSDHQCGHFKIIETTTPPNFNSCLNSSGITREGEPRGDGVESEDNMRRHINAGGPIESRGGKEPVTSRSRSGHAPAW